MEVRVLSHDELSLLADIDRSEVIHTLFRVEDGELRGRSEMSSVPPWEVEGDSRHAVPALRRSLEPILERGGLLLGAFVDDEVAGLSIIEPAFEPPLAWLVFLHVSRGYRRRGVATALWDESVRLARNHASESMYVSATPSDSAVGFYLAQGCHVAAQPHAQLYAEEPEDIHFICPL